MASIPGNSWTGFSSLAAVCKGAGSCCGWSVRHVGFSTHGPLEVILAAINTNLFEFVNLHYYYFFQRNAAAIELAQKKIWVLIISPADKEDASTRRHKPSKTCVILTARVKLSIFTK